MECALGSDLETRRRPAVPVTGDVGAPVGTDTVTAAMLWDHLYLQRLLLAHGSPAQREFIAAEALEGRRFAGAWPVPVPADDEVGFRVDGRPGHRVGGNSHGPDGRLRLLPRPAGGRLLIGYQHVPAHSATADWPVFRVRDRGVDLLVLVPHDSPRLSFDVADRPAGRSEPTTGALLNGVRVLDSWLIPLEWARRCSTAAGAGPSGRPKPAAARCRPESAGVGADGGVREQANS